MVLTTFDADTHVLRALQAGAAGFLLKDTPPAELIHAIHRVAAGDAQLSPSVIRQLIAHATGGGEGTAAARAVGAGASNAEIADRVHLSVPTVKGHVPAGACSDRAAPPRTLLPRPRRRRVRDRWDRG